VDQHKTVSPNVIEAVARDFDLHESGTPDRVTQAVVPANPEKLDVVEALRTLATLADRLRRPRLSFPRREDMSRIHEALKRAEQERGTHSGLDQQVVDQGMPPGMAARMAATVVADAPMTFEALQARTARVPGI